MTRTDAIIIGGGQAGLAMSRCLSQRGIDHVVLERGRVAQRWRTERWDSLRLLTPNWQSRLPGWTYGGANRDGFMSVREVIDYLAAYASTYRMPIETDTTVLAVAPDPVAGYRVDTTRGTWRAPNVVIATGHCDAPLVPALARRASRDLHHIVPSKYRSPASVPDGGVLVVGASATGVQLADELARAGRDVVLSVGRHARIPRRYRGRDIMWWFDQMGRLHEPLRPGYDRSQPSLQLVGRDDGRDVDLDRLADDGVRLVGRAVSADGHRVSFADDLADNVAVADAKLARSLARIDRFIGTPGPGMAPIRVGAAPATIDLRAEGIRTILWATGFVRRYPWLHVPVLDRRGEIAHDRGFTAAPGLLALGLQYQQRRSSSFIDGVGLDARVLADHIAARVGAPAHCAA